MASLSHAQAAVAEPVARPRPRPRSRKKSQSLARGGILWIVNVAVLRLNLGLDGANSERVKLRAENAALQSQLSSELASPRIQSQAAARLGLVYADPSDYGYVDLTKK